MATRKKPPGKKCRTWATYKFDLKKDGEINDQPSLTVPDQVLSIHEILARFTRGQSVATLTPVWGSDMPDIENMDPIERMEYAKNLRDSVKRGSAARDAAQKAAAAAAAEDAQIVDDDPNNDSPPDPDPSPKPSKKGSG